MAFGNASTNSYVFVGGLPSWYGGDVAGLENVVLPTVLLEPRFRGAIRNLAYKDARANDNTALNNVYSISRRNPLPLQDLTAYKVRFHSLFRIEITSYMKIKIRYLTLIVFDSSFQQLLDISKIHIQCYKSKCYANLHRQNYFVFSALRDKFSVFSKLPHVYRTLLSDSLFS